MVAAFYAYQGGAGRGPAINPVPNDGPSASGRNAHHSPMEPWRPARRGSYRQKTEQRVPRAIPDGLYEELFSVLRCDRDRTIVSLLVSSGARAAELLGMTGGDVDWGGQRVRLIGKGTRDEAWVVVSPDFFGWLGRYLARERPALQASGPLWLTLRTPHRPLAYQALRAVLLRANDKLGTNLVLHDLRHTCALRLASDPTIPLTDVQAHLRHRHLSTTAQTYLVALPEEVIRRVQAHQHALQQPGQPQAQTTRAAGWAYAAADPEVLLGQPTPEPAAR